MSSFGWVWISLFASSDTIKEQLESSSRSRQGSSNVLSSNICDKFNDNLPMDNWDVFNWWLISNDIGECDWETTSSGWTSILDMSWLKKDLFKRNFRWTELIDTFVFLRRLILQLIHFSLEFFFVFNSFSFKFNWLNRMNYLE